jgi:alpha-ketoglutarate-dependent taurine dioxygenase
MNTRKLHSGFEVEDHALRQAEMRAQSGYAEIRNLLKRYPLLLFRNQCSSDDEVTALIADQMEFATQPRYLYLHAWRAGEVPILDERATLYRGCPWPHAEPRRLHSICISAGPTDSPKLMRPGRAKDRVPFFK